MKKHFYSNIAFQIMLIISFGLSLIALVQYMFSKRMIEEAILKGTKNQAYTYLLGIERQIQSLNDPFDAAQLTEIFQNARLHDTDTLNFAIINVYMYDRLGKVIAYLDEPETMYKDLGSRYGDVLRTQKTYLGDKIEEHQIEGREETIRIADIITPVHFSNNVIGGLEVEIDMNKTFALISKLDNRYELQTFVMLCVSILLLLAFIWSILNMQLISPVRKIGQATRKIADGDFKTRVDIRSSNEIGALGESVDKMARNLERLFAELDATYLGTLNSLSRALEARDDYTANHSANVTRYALELGRYLKLSQEQMAILEQGAMLHDLGKIGIPDDILKKENGLNDIERDIIQQHPPLTSSILDPLERFKHFSAIARHHHERWDGKGYPDGLAGEDIPLLARIVAITDSWDAMTSDRVYRKGMNREQALEIFELERDNGQWDPFLVDQFVTLLRKNNLYENQPIDIAA